MKKSKAPLKLLTDFENHSSTVTRFKDLKARFLTVKMFTGSRL
jgi:hypothetical protein